MNRIPPYLLAPRMVSNMVTPRGHYFMRYVYLLDILAELQRKHKRRKWFKLRGEVFKVAEAEKASTDAVNLVKWGAIETKTAKVKGKKETMYRMTKAGELIRTDKMLTNNWCVTVDNVVTHWSPGKYFRSNMEHEK